MGDSSLTSTKGGLCGVPCVGGRRIGVGTACRGGVTGTGIPSSGSRGRSRGTGRGGEPSGSHSGFSGGASPSSSTTRSTPLSIRRAQLVASNSFASNKPPDSAFGTDVNRSS